MDIVSKFLQTVQGVSSIEQLEFEFKNALAQLECETFTYTRHIVDPVEGEHKDYVLSSGGLQEWLDYFWEQDFAEIDDIGKEAQQHILPTPWCLLEWSKKFPDNKLYKDGLDYGLRSGISIPVFYKHDSFGMFVMQHKEIHRFLERHPEKLHELHNLVMIYHEYLNKFIMQSTSDLKLTAREKQCLMLTAQNKTAQQVADELNISLRTVGFHMANIIKRFGVSNKYQALAVALRLGLIEG